MTSPPDRAHLLKHELEELVVEAKKIGLSLAEVTDAVAEHWGTLDRHPVLSRRKA